MKLLLIEDDWRTAQFIVKGFSQEGFTVDHASDGLDGLFMAEDGYYDIAIVDLMLPKLDGLSLIERLRKQQIQTPIIVLSAKKTVDDRILGLQKGGDDYMVKPFSFSELLVRVHTILRRSQTIDKPMTLNIADLTLNMSKRQVFRGKQQIDLQQKEYALLEYLIRNSGRVLSKTMIMEHVWGYNFDPQSNVVESRMCRLREKIDKGHAIKLLHTIRGVGYLLEEKE
jgi:two-component system OmpR family response regulator